MITGIREHAHKVMTQVQFNGAGKSQLVASWHRCLLRHNLDPTMPTELRRLDAHELSRARQGAAPLIRAFQRALRDQKSAFPGQRVCALVTDANGIVLSAYRHGIDADCLARMGLSQGYDWSEAHRGTNGVGTCLVSERPVTIRRDEHFYLPIAPMACVAAPIFGPDGELSGAFNLSLLSRTADSAFARQALLFLAISVARDIEKTLFVNAYPDCRIITMGDTSRSGVGLFAVDQDDVVIGATRMARTLKGLTPQSLLKGIPASDIFEDNGKDSFAQAERAVLRRALLRTRGNVTAAADCLEISRATMKRKVGKHFTSPVSATPQLRAIPARHRPN
ncbi:Acetoin catabolism regulatory protein [Sulfitobacter sp. DSM 110093]|uniref:GAF domain-containing protein n=1 Tax=Sulfitobacter sp. DSM 110093 TaxID=2883127 RepID=UPI001FADF416|nr:GAF domain-containing protein [Sulfitobacter sp. DSM 110093]UOA32848.1 Acetoin catabolism regulatory protein [Sulfitobacter sp. DSM 110093]